MSFKSKLAPMLGLNLDVSRFLRKTPSPETFFARTAWSRRKFQISAKNCAKFVHAHSRKPHPNSLRELCRCIPAQISHNLSTFLEAPAHLSHKFSGTCRECPAHKFCTIFSGTRPVLTFIASVQAMNVSILADAYGNAKRRRALQALVFNSCQSSRGNKRALSNVHFLAHQNRTIAIASDFHVD